MSRDGRDDNLDAMHTITKVLVYGKERLPSPTRAAVVASQSRVIIARGDATVTTSARVGSGSPLLLPSRASVMVLRAIERRASSLRALRVWCTDYQRRMIIRCIS